MPDILATSLLGLLTVLVAACLLLILRRGRAPNAETEVLKERLSGREAEIDSLRAQCTGLDDELARLREANIALREQLGREQTQLTQERERHRERLDLLQNAKETMTHEFRNLANEILDLGAKASKQLDRKMLEDMEDDADGESAEAPALAEEKADE